MILSVQTCNFIVPEFSRSRSPSGCFLNCWMEFSAVAASAQQVATTRTVKRRSFGRMFVFNRRDRKEHKEKKAALGSALRKTELPETVIISPVLLPAWL